MQCVAYEMAFLPPPVNVTDSSHLAYLVPSLHNLSDWMKLGVLLGIPYSTLKKLVLDKQKVNDRKIAMFHLWLSRGGANKETLLRALSKMDHH